jgi:small subunit ribosomal protein S8
MVNDTLSDLLTRIRNANMSKAEEVSLPSFKLGEKVCEILKEEGFIADLTVLDDEFAVNQVYLDGVCKFK